MKVIFLGKHSEGRGGHCKGIQAIQHLLDCGCKIECIVSCDNSLDEFITEKKLISKKIKEVEAGIIDKTIKDVDFIISYGYTKKIKEPLISSSRFGCINFHPAPLPEWRGMGGVFNFALFEEVSEWGVAAHYVDEFFDSGDIIKSKQFKINPACESVNSLIKKSHNELLILFKEVINYLLKQPHDISSQKQRTGRYISKKDFNNLRKIHDDDSIETIDKKIKAFFYPPYGGAFVIIKGKEYTLINEQILKKIKRY